MTHVDENAGNSKEDSILKEDSRMGKNKSKENFELSGFHWRPASRMSSVGDTHLQDIHSVLYYPAFFHDEDNAFKTVLEYREILQGVTIHHDQVGQFVWLHGAESI